MKANPNKFHFVLGDTCCQAKEMMSVMRRLKTLAVRSY